MLEFQIKIVPSLYPVETKFFDEETEIAETGPSLLNYFFQIVLISLFRISKE
jgi:hypothetical protein